MESSTAGNALAKKISPEDDGKARRPADSKRRTVEVLCLTYGEPPENTWAVQTTYSLSILNRLTRRVAPIPRYITPLIAARRGWIRAKTFREKNWRSPLEEISVRQVTALEQRLKAARPDLDFRTRLVLEFRPPYLQNVLGLMVANHPDELIIQPLYVADSDFTSGVSQTDLQNFHRKLSGRHGIPAPKYVEGFGFDERAGECFARFIMRKCEEAGWTAERLKKSVLILGAHGTIIRPPVGMNNGARETRYFYGLIRKHVKHHFKSVRIGWLNHTVGGEWTFPAVGQAAAESQNQGIRSTVYMTFGFMGDNGETQLEGPAQLNEYTWDDQLIIPSPNDDPEFMDLLSTRVLERLDGPAASWESIKYQNPKCIYRERAAIPGTSGFLKLSSPQVAKIALSVMILVGSLLMAAAVSRSGYQAGNNLAWFFPAVAVGWGALYARKAGLEKVIRNFRRLRARPQPVFVGAAFSRGAWLCLLLVAGFAFLPLHGWFYSTLCAFWGACYAIAGILGFAFLREAQAFVPLLPRLKSAQEPVPV
jgi:protoporphyrin/coproporphyrin ferrochelatase